MANSAARKLLSELALKFNPNHDEQGRFAEGPGLGELKLKAVTAREFTHARDSGSKRPGYLSPKTTQEVHQEIQQGGKARLGADGKVGYLLTKQGDLQNLFNNGGPKGAGVRAAIHAVSDGAKTLDCFDGYLRRTYQALGFEEVGRVKFNDDYAPPHLSLIHI